MSKHEEKVDTMKTKPISDDQSGQTDKDGQKLLVSVGGGHKKPTLVACLSFSAQVGSIYICGCSFLLKHVNQDTTDQH